MVQSTSSGMERARVLRPGLPLPGPDMERHCVPGGGSIVVTINGDDRLRIINVEGEQRCEVTPFAEAGSPDPGMFGRAPDGAAEGIKSILAREGAEGPTASRLVRHGIDITGAKSISLFSPDSRPGDAETLVSAGRGTVIVAAPGGPMRVDEQNPPTELTVYIQRAEPVQPGQEHLPEPLAEPRLDIRVDRRTAKAFEVKAGEFIQVIDVAGRQCSDFQAFDVSKLEKGIERCLDVTTTRTLMGHGYPGPGLHAKYYDQDFKPLVEMIQDSCTRHDAFGLACAAKYYEDAGYFGHINCSDNFNNQLAQHSIAPRRGWMAMNFFYNTGIDDNNQFYLDEPWSRPGDYVLMQALTDLVGISSACPDDISSANNWDPTDIHVRVYPASLSAKRSIGFRKRPDSEVEMTKETGFHARTSKLTRNFVEYNGYWLASDYTNLGAIDEYWACREKAVVLDLSPLRKFEVVGPDAETLMQRCVTRNVRRLAPGDVVYTAMCYNTGTMVDDGTVFRLGEDNFRWIGGNDYGGEWLRKQAHEMGLDVRVRSSTDQLHNIAVQGPLSRSILRKIIWTPPAQPNMDELDWFKFSIGRIGDFDGVPVMVSRTGYSGELGYEVFCHPDDAPAVWDAVWEAGEPEGMVPLGLDALDMLRIESGLIFAGYEFDDQTDPFEAGIGFTVPLKSKQEDFIGREALVKRKENPQRKLVGLELIGSEQAQHGDCVHVGRHQVGVVTSGMRSPVLAKNIALCRMAVEYAEPGTEVEVGKLDGHQKRLPATVVAFPHYDPKKERPRS
ncbi:MAG: DUF1989 domain-containing protein [Rhodospirillales bacterium]